MMGGPVTKPGLIGPVISAAAVSASTLWPPNHEMVDVTVSFDVTYDCALLESTLSVTSNQPSDSGLPDWEVVDAHHVRLRAERSGGRGDRVYTITISVKDVDGNMASQNVTVTVPQRPGKGSKWNS